MAALRARLVIIRSIKNDMFDLALLGHHSSFAWRSGQLAFGMHVIWSWRSRAKTAGPVEGVVETHCIVGRVCARARLNGRIDFGARMMDVMSRGFSGSQNQTDTLACPVAINIPPCALAGVAVQAQIQVACSANQAHCPPGAAKQ